MGKTKQLTAVSVNAKKEAGYYADGNGLYLRVASGGSKTWVFRYMLSRKAREMGLGSINIHSLSEARELVINYKKLLLDAVDPIEYRKAKINEQLSISRNKKTFKECVDEYIAIHRDSWKNAKHAGQWSATLNTYANSVFGDKDISLISKADVLSVVEPIWSGKTETAYRVLQRIKSVMEWSAARDYIRNYDNSMWSQIKRSLPSKEKIKKQEHFASCHYTKINSVIKQIRESNSHPSLINALEFLILDASRSGEVRKCEPKELDINNKQWIIPAEKMKAGKEHRVPLSSRAIEILNQQEYGQRYVFEVTAGKAISDMSLTMLLRRLGFDFTVHGFRSTFRDWAAEQTSFAREICESALSHTVKNKSEAAYFRSDLFEKRRLLMQAWADYCAMEQVQTDKVVAIRSA